ncbi:MAG: hypothetical protein KF764_25845 [Labilithrix sp.]|nr:hypothetical protein [Labilithrix sp.]MBX3225224.1 hypothetical protein [Labilithrix sp.]
MTEVRAEPLATSAQGLREKARGHTDSLKKVKLPETRELRRFIKDRAAALRLGKALFWDQQVGSDGQACASCHFHAGADNRSKSQLNPGTRTQVPGIDPTRFNDPTGFGDNLNHFRPNYQLTPEDFPFHKLYDPTDRTSRVISDTNDTVSSQGVFNAEFIATGIPFDLGIPSLAGTGAIFNVDGVLVRNVEPRQAPPAINSAFNHRNFWDGRARFEFNGVSPIGQLDPGVRVVERIWGTTAALVTVRIPESSLASQAVGPVTSDQETAFGIRAATFVGRRFTDTARKLLDAAVVPLGQQEVAKDDSVLGRLSAAPANGIKKRYQELVREAFEERWWNVPGFVVDVSGKAPVLKKQTKPSGPNQFTVMEYNFSLFFGLAVQEYERTLVSDDAPFDRFMDGDDHALTDQQQQGLEVFLDKGKCVNCHGGAELTNASLANVRNDQIIERMVMGDNRVAVYDNGFYNIGVRPTLEDIGVGARIGPRDLPLSNSRLFQRELADLVRMIQAWNPYLPKEAAIRLANRALGIPRIRARPEEAEPLLTDAAPAAAEQLASAREAVVRAISSCPPWRLGDSNKRLAAIDALLAKAAASLAAGSANGAAPKLDEASEKLDELAARLGARVDAQTNKARELLWPGLSLLPDRVDPGHDRRHPKAPPLRPDERVAVDGAFKTPSLRNVAHTAPYFHNGGQATLAQVVEFYNRGGDFARENQKDLDPDIRPLDLTVEERAALVAFLEALTDERVQYERAPFDHPSLSLPNGGSTPVLTPIFPTLPGFEDRYVLEDRFVLPATGLRGNAVSLGTRHTPYADFLHPLE